MGDGRRRRWAAGGVGVRLLNEPKRPGSIREWPGAPWLAVGAVCVGAFMGQLDASIVTLALPSLQRSFDASLGAVTWVALSYLLVLVALVTAFGGSRTWPGASSSTSTASSSSPSAQPCAASPRRSSP